MRTRNLIFSLGFGAALAVAAGVFLHSKKAAPRQEINTELEPSPLTELWLARLRNERRFADGDARAPANAEAFLSLALGNSPPRLVAAALHALEMGLTARPQQARRLSEAVSANLDSADDEVVGAALSVARSLLAADGNTSTIEKRILGLAPRLSQGPGRHALLDSLASLPAARVGEPHIALAQQSLGDSAPFVRSRALRFLEVHGQQANASNAPELAASVRQHLADPDPGVRGRAAVVHATLGQADSAALRDMLKDPVPYVRAQACAALARAKNVEYLSNILELVASTMVARYDIRGWTTLEGDPGCESHVSSSSGYLGESAGTALVLLSDGQVRLEPVASKDIQATLRRNQELLASFFAKTGGIHK